MCYSILAIELTLYKNNVGGVYEVSSTGQFIPLLIGILGLGRALVCAFVEHRPSFRKVSRGSPLTYSRLITLTVKKERHRRSFDRKGRAVRDVPIPHQLPQEDRVRRPSSVEKTQFGRPRSHARAAKDSTVLQEPSHRPGVPHQIGR